MNNKTREKNDYKNKIKKASDKINKFFQDNIMEIPRKFTSNGMNGICVHLFTNAALDAGDVVKFRTTKV